ncbi:acetyltransferase [Marinobacter sp. F4216]|uniref:acetyltransferase n=1 Tax=Marinobacter sp. F4216 TaxID=2874281 RepID=UPI001CC04E15|nr:acetyltransferase [Marinobacter sp. F4216]MBZ2168415.1 acetyltransferase [Marinobacter sp. F4216]
MKRLAILGASGHGKVVADAAQAQGWGEICFYDDAFASPEKNATWPVVGNFNQLIKDIAGFDGVIVAIGNNMVRQRKLTALKEAGAVLATIVHPAAVVSEYAVVGCGSVILAGSVINAGAEVGEGTIVNTGAVVEHDCVVGPSVHISPNATLSGGVTLGPLVWIGAGAAVKQLVVVGEACVVGMGAVVISDTLAGTTVVGIPAKEI